MRTHARAQAKASDNQKSNNRSGGSVIKASSMAVASMAKMTKMAAWACRWYHQQHIKHGIIMAYKSSIAVKRRENGEKARCPSKAYRKRGMYRRNQAGIVASMASKIVAMAA